MPAYVIGRVNIEDPDGFQEYAQGVAATVEEHGGRYLARGGEVEVLEGSCPPRVAVLQFDSAEAARGWYESEEYQALAAIRQRCATSDLVIVHGLEA